MAAGIPVGILCRTKTGFVRIVSVLTTLSIYALLFVLGVSLGNDSGLITKLGEIGVKAVTISLSCTFFSCLAAWIVGRFLLKNSLDTTEGDDNEK